MSDEIKINVPLSIDAKAELVARARKHGRAIGREAQQILNKTLYSRSGRRAAEQERADA